MLNDNGKNKMVDGVTAVATHVSLHTAVPDNTGSNEVAGGSYARQAVAWDAAVSGVGDNTASESWSVPSSTTVVAFGLWSASSGGTFYGHSLLGNTKRGVATVAVDDTFTSNGHTLADGDRVVVYNVFSESIPTGLTEGTVYHVVSAATNTFKLSTSAGGAAVDVTAVGEVFWMNCIPETFSSAGTLDVAAGDLDISAVVL